jgi:hypothetical protein
MGDYSHTWTTLNPRGSIDVNSGRGGLYATWYSHGIYLMEPSMGATTATIRAAPAWEELRLVTPRERSGAPLSAGVTISILAI